jgi:uncharacterized protein (UPF0218 family)
LRQADIDALKKPFGTLVPDAHVTKQKVLSLAKGATRIIAVGDATTERLLSFGITPDLAVVDGKERRHERDYPEYSAKEMRCANPAGTISRKAVEVLQGALVQKQPVRVVIEGEEDLLALPLFVMAPVDSIVMYGQPLEGLVVVRITAAKRQEAKDLMDRIGLVD